MDVTNESYTISVPYSRSCGDRVLQSGAGQPVTSLRLWRPQHPQRERRQLGMYVLAALPDEPRLGVDPELVFEGPVDHLDLAILNNVTGDSAIPFCGLVTEGLPRLQRLLADEIREDNDATPGPAELARVYINGERASIPNVGWIQQQLLRLR